MGQITGGRILFGDAVKHNPGDQYSSSRKAEAEFYFSVSEGERHDAMTDAALGLARAKVAELLTGKSAPATSTAIPAGAGKTAAEIEDGDKKKAAAAAKAAAKAAKTPPTGDAGDVVVEPAGNAAKVVEAKVVADDGLGDLLGEQAPAEVSDAELTSQITRQNGKVQNPNAIRALVGKYAGPAPKAARDIPQKDRAAFLAELATVTPVAGADVVV